MQETVSARTPTHLWIVGVLSLLWNAYGCFDYLMTRTHNMAYLSGMMPGADINRMLAYIEGMPMYAQVGWGLGVWSALLAAILLLMRSRWAVWAFAISLVGMAMSFGGQYLGPPPPSEMTAGAMKYVPFFIVLLGLAQFYYAWRQEKNGVLR